MQEKNYECRAKILKMEELILKMALLTIEYLMCIADISFEGDFGSYGTTCTVSTCWFLIYSENR